MSGFVKDLGTLLFSRGAAVERKAAEFKAQREKRAADFAERAAREKAEPPPQKSAIPAPFVDAAGEIAEKLGLGTKAKTRELAERLGRAIGRLFS